GSSSTELCQWAAPAHVGRGGGCRSARPDRAPESGLYDARMVIASTTSDLLSSLLPLLLLFAFWFFLMKRVRNRPAPGQEALLEKLDEIRDEIRRLRKT